MVSPSRTESRPSPLCAGPEESGMDPRNTADPGGVSVNVTVSGALSVVLQIVAIVVGAPTLASLTRSWTVAAHPYEARSRDSDPASGSGESATQLDSAPSQAVFAACACTV